MRKLTAIALAVPLALGLGALTTETQAAPASSGALSVLPSDALQGGAGGATVKDGLVEPAYYYYRRRYYRPYYRYGYRPYYRPYYAPYYRPYGYGYYGYGY